MKIIRNKKFKWSILILLVILFTTLMIILKLLNNIYFANTYWNEQISNVLNEHLSNNWFSNLKSFLSGPIGLYSMVQSHLYNGDKFLTPVFLDALINWVYLFSILTLITMMIINLKVKIVKNKKTKPILVEKESILEDDNLIQDEKTKTLILKEKILVEDKLIKKTKYDKVSKTYLIKKLVEMYPDMTKKSINEVVNHVFAIIEESLLKGEDVLIENFGKLVKIHKPKKQAINPSTGEVVKVPASYVIKFKASRKLKDLMSDTKWTGIHYKKKTIEKVSIEEIEE